MRVRTLALWKKYKLVWMILLGWSIVGAFVLLFLGYSVLDLRGGLPRIDALYTEKIDMTNVEEIALQAEGIKVELAESYHVKELTVQFYGTDYRGQRLAWQNDQGKLLLTYQPYPVTANVYGIHQEPEIVLRLIVPTKDYRQIAVTGNWLVGEFYQTKADLLRLEINHGRIFVGDGVLQRLQIETADSEVELRENQIVQLNLYNQRGNSLVSDNRIHYWQYDGPWGDLTVWNKEIKGNWQLAGKWGQIMVATGKQPDNLLLDLQTQKGMITLGYDDKLWEILMKESLVKNQLRGMVGQGENILNIDNAQGSIVLRQEKHRL